MISFGHFNQVGVEGEDELVAVLEFYTGLGLIAYWGWSHFFLFQTNVNW